ncbi:8-amino-7-oxononanoate synthase [Marinomonas piezotolerans]|uniref:8-amino-7-oxononanoate synthase n=1 Tax=Marinomonas piezotolerans TaxID=2213058 RepID=A0A370U7D0_9GAMM|nr:8-amino-7-oxononanoate synthase [Marinomonas piezotolerans]RDL43672.1 8-amino-7-oxononanoate synthase [Marinomonas piezotolerans]
MPACKTPDWVRDALNERRAHNLLRRVRPITPPQSTHVSIAGENFVSFCSNDYLGLANHPDLKQVMADAAIKWGVGSGASHLVTGHLDIHVELETALSDWLGFERILLFSTGYMANLAVVSALGSKQRPVVMDKLNHASLIDGARLSEAPFRRYLHNDIDSAAKLMQRFDSPGVLATDGVFSMDGDVAPVAELAQLARQNNWLFVVDDAHGLGCIGEDGRGVLAEQGCTAEDVPFLVGTFGKAFGVAGAFVACSEDMANYLTQFARPYIYTTAMPPAVAATVLASLEIIRSSEGYARRARLADNIAMFRERAKRWPFDVMFSNSAIQPILIGDSALAMRVSKQLESARILCTAIRPPTVPPNTARLRVTLSAEHSPADVMHLCDTLDLIFNDECK